MVSDAELDKTNAAVQETLRKADELDGKVLRMREERENLLNQYGLNSDKIANYLTNGNMPPSHRAALQKEEEQFRLDLERDMQAATEKVGLQSSGAKPKPVIRRRNMV